MDYGHNQWEREWNRVIKKLEWTENQGEATGLGSRARVESRRNNDYEMRKELLQLVRLVGDLTSRSQIMKGFLANLWMDALGIWGGAETPRRKQW